MTLSLIKSYGLYPELRLIEAQKASREELEKFHSTDYLDHCEKTRETDDLEKLDANSSDKFGMEYDCPLISDIMTMIQWVAGKETVTVQKANYF